MLRKMTKNPEEIKISELLSQAQTLQYCNLIVDQQVRSMREEVTEAKNNVDLGWTFALPIVVPLETGHYSYSRIEKLFYIKIILGLG